MCYLEGRACSGKRDDISPEDDWQVFNKLKQEIRL
jgi:hypothetical protein